MSSQQQINFKTRTMAHGNDPASSHEAAERTTRSGKKATHMAAVLATVMRHPGSTAAELAQYLSYGAVEVRRRLSDLKREGTIERGPSRFCNEAGTHAVTWRVKR